jgi:hypothetical protein
VFTVSLEDILTVEKSLSHRQQAVGEENDNKAHITDVLTVVGNGRIVAGEQKHHRQTHDNASHVARETAGIGAEVEKGKDVLTYDRNELIYSKVKENTKKEGQRTFFNLKLKMKNQILKISLSVIIIQLLYVTKKIMSLHLKMLSM